MLLLELVSIRNLLRMVILTFRNSNSNNNNRDWQWMTFIKVPIIIITQTLHMVSNNNSNTNNKMDMIISDSNSSNVWTLVVITSILPSIMALVTPFTIITLTNHNNNIQCTTTITIPIIIIINTPYKVMNVLSNTSQMWWWCEEQPRKISFSTKKIKYKKLQGKTLTTSLNMQLDSISTLLNVKNNK